MTDPDQYRFREGELVLEEQTPDKNLDSIEPGDEAGYRVAVKPGALDANVTLRDAVEEYGHTLEFGSKLQAERYAETLSASDSNLRIQATAPNDPDDVHAYLLAEHDPAIKEPASVNGQTLTFDVGANLYGTLGEAILTAGPKPHALIYFVKQDLDISDENLEDRLTVDVETDCFVSLDAESAEKQLAWKPDCKILARDGWNGDVLEQYYCEIKTGNASFERSQIATMRELAAEERVLKIRVLIDDLPDQYSLRIHEVEPDPDSQ